MTRQLDITDAQIEASDRANIDGSIYLLSGTFVGRAGVPDAPFYWSTREVTVFGQTWKPYIAAPVAVQRGMGFEPGAESSFPEVRVPVRNLPFAHSESLVAAITDDDFRFESVVATLRVAYLRPGKTVADLVAADYTPLILNGFLGPPDEVTLDGLILPIYSRGARRNQALVWPVMPSPETMTNQGAIDAKDAGTMPPLIMGMVNDWIRVPTLNLGVRGFAVSGYSAGTISGIKFRAITVGSENLASGNVPTTNSNTEGPLFDGAYGSGTGKAGLLIHYLFPIYLVASATFDATTKEFTVTLTSGLAGDIPRGAFIQQWGPGFDVNQSPPQVEGNLGGFHGWSWMLGNQMNSSATHPHSYGWLFPDGEVRPAEAATWTFVSTKPSDPETANLDDYGGRNIGGLDADAAGGTRILLSRGIKNSPAAPVYYDPLANIPQDVAQQPEFESEETAFGVLNRPSGGSDSGSGSGTNADARDGSWATNVLVEAGHSITLTFPSAPAPFANDDTTSSVLHIVCRASTGEGGETAVNVYGDSVVLGNEIFEIPVGLGTAEPTEFIVQMPGPVDFNESLTFTSNTLSTPDGAARIVEAWWEHNLSTTVTATRTVDVALTSGSVPLGPVMQFAELVIQPAKLGSQWHALNIEDGGVSNNDSTTETFPGTSGAANTYTIPYPTPVMRGLHMLLGTIEGDEDTINLANYTAAHAKFIEHNIRLGFVWTEDNRPGDWTEIERELGLQSRSYCFYGPSGHEFLFLEEGSGYDAFTVRQTFRLPGVPGANVFGTGQPLYSRTRSTELVNQYEVQWDRDPIKGAFRRNVIKQNTESIGDLGVRAHDRGPAPFYMHFPNEGNSNFTVAETLSGIVQFYADRQAFAQTRFAFDTAWVAHGLDRGSIIRVAYPVSQKPDSYRNVRAEVESVEVSPLDGERFSIVARSIEKPQKGIDAAYTWADVFETGDIWTDEILQEFDTWTDYWSVQT